MNESFSLSPSATHEQEIPEKEIPDLTPEEIYTFERLEREFLDRQRRRDEEAEIHLAMLENTLANKSIDPEKRLRQSLEYLELLPASFRDEVKDLYRKYQITTEDEDSEPRLDESGWMRLKDFSKRLGSKAKMLLPSESEVPFDPERRKFVAASGVVGARVVAGAVLGSVLSAQQNPLAENGPETAPPPLPPEDLPGGFENKDPRNEALKNFGKWFERSENSEYIITHSKKFLKIPPGTVANGENPYEENREGRDKRSLVELMFVRSFLAKSNPQKAQEITEHLDENNDNGLLNPAAFNFPPFEGVLTASDFNYAFQVCSSRMARTVLMDEFYALQQNGHFTLEGIPQIERERLRWLEEYNKEPGVKIKEKTLAWAEIMYPIAEAILTECPEIWFEASDLPAEDRINHIQNHGITNPAAMATLEETETFGGTYTGDTPFSNNLNPDLYWFTSTAEQDLDDFAERLKIETGIDTTFEVTLDDGTKVLASQLVTGSKAGSGDSTGGAVFGQIMPPSLTKLREMWTATRLAMQAKGYDLPPFMPGTPAFMSLLKYLWMNGRWWNYEGDRDGRHIKRGRKGGYLEGQEEFELAALYSWNPKRTQMTQVLRAKNSYKSKGLTPQFRLIHKN